MIFWSAGHFYKLNIYQKKPKEKVFTLPKTNIFVSSQDYFEG